MKKKVKVFVSYAHRNQELAKKFIDQFYDYVAASKSYEYIFWNDLELQVGEKWDDKIKEKINECDCGLLLLSTSFLNSKYITETELPTLMENKKVLIPVLLQSVDMERHDLKGLKEYQIYRFRTEGFKDYRSYGDLKPKSRINFVKDLFITMEDRLNEYFVKK